MKPTISVFLVWSLFIALPDSGQCKSTPGLFTLTALHLQQGFGQDAAGHADRLADVIARVFDLDVRDGQLAAQRHGETTRLWRLLDGEQQDLKRKDITWISLFSYLASSQWFMTLSVRWMSKNWAACWLSGQRCRLTAKRFEPHPAFLRGAFVFSVCLRGFFWMLQVFKR